MTNLVIAQGATDDEGDGDELLVLVVGRVLQLGCLCQRARDALLLEARLRLRVKARVRVEGEGLGMGEDEGEG